MFNKSLAELKGHFVFVSPFDPNDEAYGEGVCDAAPVLLTFANETVVRADYWRVVENGRAVISNFDHRQKFGLPARINALDVLDKILRSKPVTEAVVDSETGDLLFNFAPNIKVQVFNFTAYEVWDVSLPNGAVEYSNRVERGS